VRGGALDGTTGGRDRRPETQQDWHFRVRKRQNADLGLNNIEFGRKTCADRISPFMRSLCRSQVYVREGIVVDGKCRRHDLVAIGSDAVKP
jgi:hypothetical protein